MLNTLAALAGIATLFLSAAPQAPIPTPKANSTTDAILEHYADAKWTGDLDAMIKRRQVRILVPYSKTLYFVDRGQQRGLAYDVFRLFEDDFNKRHKKDKIKVHVVFKPEARGDLIQDLNAGIGDIAMGFLTITPERMKVVDFTNPTADNLSEIVVTAPGQPPVATAQDLSGREVYLRKASSYYDHVEKLNGDLKKAGKPPVKIRIAPDNLESEDILEMVNAGLVPATIVDDNRAKFWKQVFTKIELQPAAVSTGDKLAWMIRKNSPQLKKELDEFLARYPEGSSTRNQLLNKYLKNTKYVKASTSAEEAAKFDQVVKFFRKYCEQYDMDTLLMAAQGYQESRLDQGAKSQVGAVGVMQVMPATGKELAVGDIHQLEPNIHAGVKYVRFMLDKYYGNEKDMDALNKGLFTFASYNAGPGRIAQLRKIAKERGLNPNVWFNNVEIIASEKIGRETVTYVSNIYKYYLAYQLVMEQRKEREQAREEAKSQAKP